MQELLQNGQRFNFCEPFNFSLRCFVLSRLGGRKGRTFSRSSGVLPCDKPDDRVREPVGHGVLLCVAYRPIAYRPIQTIPVEDSSNKTCRSEMDVAEGIPLTESLDSILEKAFLNEIVFCTDLFSEGCTFLNYL